MLVALGRSERVKRRIAVQSRISGEQHPPVVSLANQDGPVGRRLVRAPHDIDPRPAEAGSIRMQKLLEALSFCKSTAKPGIPIRLLTKELRELLLTQASSRILSKDGPAVATPARGIEKIDI